MIDTLRDRKEEAVQALSSAAEGARQVFYRAVLPWIRTKRGWESVATGAGPEGCFAAAAIGPDPFHPDLKNKILVDVLADADSTIQVLLDHLGVTARATFHLEGAAENVASDVTAWLNECLAEARSGARKHLRVPVALEVTRIAEAALQCPKLDLSRHGRLTRDCTQVNHNDWKQIRFGLLPWAILASLSPSMPVPSRLGPMDLGASRFPMKPSRFRGRAKTIDKYRRGRHRKLNRFSARGSAHRIAIRFGGIRPQDARAVKTPRNPRQNWNVFRGRGLDLPRAPNKRIRTRPIRPLARHSPARSALKRPSRWRPSRTYPRPRA